MFGQKENEMITLVAYFLWRLDAGIGWWILFGVWAFCRILFWTLKIYHAFADVAKDPPSNNE